MPELQHFLDADQLRRATFIRDVELHETIGSTNERAAELVRDTTIELPALVAARIQTAGKGRGRNKWWSAEGALTFSVLIDSDAMRISGRNWPLLSIAAAVAICDALALSLAETKLGIKWPNDVVAGGQKIAGILIESPGSPAIVKNRLIIGIGINVNNTLQSAPQELERTGTALCELTGMRHSLQTVLMSTLQALSARLLQLANGDPRLPQAWQRLSWLTEKRIEVQSNNHRITGICLGIDTDGALLVEDGSGTDRVHNGSVRVI